MQRIRCHSLGNSRRRLILSAGTVQSKLMGSRLGDTGYGGCRMMSIGDMFQSEFNVNHLMIASLISVV